MRFSKLIFGLSVVCFASCGKGGDNNQNGATQDAATTEMPVIDNLENMITNNFSSTYKGTIDNKYAINLEFIKFKDLVGGFYHYEGKTSSLTLKGRIEDTGEFTVSEYNAEGSVTGSFEGKLVGEELSGTWYNKKRTKSMSFSLKRTSIASLQTKTDVLSDAMGQYALTSIAGGIGANGMFDTYLDNGKWQCTSSGIISSQRVVQGIDLTEADIQFLNNLYIEVDDYMNVHVMAGLTELVNSPFKATELDYRVNETDKTKMNEKIAKLSPETIYEDYQLYVIANDHMDFSGTLKGSFDMIASDNMILSYYPAERKFELDIFNKECCNGNILTFEKK